MKIWSDDSIRNFNFWSGARDTVDDLFDSDFDILEPILEEYFDGDGVCVVEWAQFVADELPTERLEIVIDHVEGGREVQLTPIGQHYMDIVKKVLS